MPNAPNPAPDLTAVPGGRWLAGLSLAGLAVVVAHLMTATGVLATITGFVTVFVLPVLGVYSVVRARVLLPRVLEWIRCQDVLVPRIVPERVASEEAD